MPSSLRPAMRLSGAKVGWNLWNRLGIFEAPEFAKTLGPWGLHQSWSLTKKSKFGRQNKTHATYTKTEFVHPNHPSCFEYVFFNRHWISPPVHPLLLRPTDPNRSQQPGLRPTTIPSASPFCPPPPRRVLACPGTRGMRRKQLKRWGDETLKAGLYIIIWFTHPNDGIYIYMYIYICIDICIDIWDLWMGLSCQTIIGSS